MLYGIENRDDIGAVLGRPVKWTMGVDRRVTLIGRDQVVKVMLFVQPVPRRDNDVALDALRSLGLAVGQRQTGVKASLIRLSASVRGEVP